MINKIIKTMRQKANLKQYELAKKCKIANSTINGYETGYREPNFEMLNIIAKECGFKIKFVNENNETLKL